MSTDKQTKTEDVIKFGETLRAAREQASYSLAYVTSQTHLKAEIIEALEQEKFSELSGDVFMRGYIRTYTKLLELDAEPLIAAYEKTKPAKPQAVAATVAQPRKKRRSMGVDPVVIWSTAAVVIISLGLLVSWWTHESAEAPVQLAEVADKFEDPLPLEENVDDREAIADHQVGLGNVSPEIDTSLQTPSVISEPNSQPEPPEQIVQRARVEELAIEAPLSGGNVDKVRIIVRYKEESWTEIFDARKRRLLHGLIQPGAVRIISGQAPLNVFLGNSPGVELEINGKPFDHSPYVRRNNTARFLIDDISS